MTVPGNLSSPLLATAAAATGAAAANITKSVRFSSPQQKYLNRTPSSSSNRKTWTWAGWVKLSRPGSDYQRIFGSEIAVNTITTIRITQLSGQEDQLEFHHNDGTNTSNVTTNAKLRDVSAWYHIVVAVDTTQATAADRTKIYINGVEQSLSVSNYLNQNVDTYINSTNAHDVGRSQQYGSYFNGYMADVHLIDGSALGPTSFGSFDSNGVWQAATYSGTFGTNGFHLFDFANEATLGHDSSGNENDFAANNISTLEGNGAYAPYLTAASGGFDTGFPPTEAFDGSTGTYARVATAATNLNFNPSSSISYSSSVKVRMPTNDANISINGGTAAFAGGGSSWTTIATGSGSISSLVFSTTGPSDKATLAGILIDDSYLLDFSVGAGNDVVFDVPVNGDASNDTGAGGELSSNYATLNYLQFGSQLSLSGGLLSLEGASGWRSAYSTIFLSSGKWYFEVHITDITTHSYGILVGLAGLGTNIINSEISSGDSYAVQNGPGNMKINHNGGSTDLGSQSAYAIGDVLQMAYDADNGKMWFGVNGTYINSGNPSAGSNPTQSSISGTYCFAVALLTTSDKIAVNFGQRAWAYTAPTNFKAVCTSNLPTPTIPDGSAHFEAKAYTGNAGTQTISGFEFTPDLAWLKHRAASQHHGLFDTQRGALMRLVSDYEYASTSRANTLTAFTSDGFSLGSAAEYNASAAHIAWVWNAGANSNKTYTVKVVSDSGNKYRFDDFGTSAVTLDLEEGSTYVFDQSDSSNAGHPIRFGTSANGTDYTTGVTHTGTPGSAGAKTTLVLGTGVATLYYSCANHSGMGGQINTNSTTGSSNFDGGIQATVKANQTAGFSMGTWTGTGSINTVGTGLSGTKVVILKNRDNTSNWVFYHTLADGSYDYMYLNEVNANASSSLAPFTMNNTFKVSSNTDTNASGDDYQFYAFSPVAGYSAMGKYTGDGDTSGNGPFVFTDFRPAFILIKANNSGGDAHWGIFDTQRVGYNASGGNPILYPNRATDEYGGSEYQIDILSNGFKIKVSYASGINFSSTDHYYIAFAENPFSANGGLAR